jgi:predicted PurR-regulated permease PerM
VSTPIIAILIVTALVTFVAFAVLIWSVVRSVTAVAADVTELRDRVLPDLERIQRDADITSRELDQVGTSLERLQDEQQVRRERRSPGTR